MLHRAKTTVTAALTSLALVVTPIAPAHALSKTERNLLKGLAAAAIVGLIANDINRKSRRNAPALRQTAPVERHQQPGKLRHNHARQPQHAYRHEAPVARRANPPGRIIGQTTYQDQRSRYGSGLDQTPAARVFNSYSHHERRRVQRRLSQYGYYNGAIDGVFGPHTYHAVDDFARRNGNYAAMETASGAHSLMSELLTR